MKKIFLIILLSVFCSTFVFGQATNWVWATNSTGTSMDNCTGVATDVSGNVFITGYFNSPSIVFGSYTLSRTGYADIFVVKYDSSGNVLWAKNFGGSNSELGLGVTTDLSGNAIVTGSFRSPTMIMGTYTLTNANSSGSYEDLFIAKLDPNGNVLWAKSAGGISTEVGTSVAADASGNIYMTGYFESSSIAFGSTTLTNANPVRSDFFLVKYDAGGNPLWAKRAGGADGDNGYSVTTDPSGNVFVTGFFDSPSITFGSVTMTNFNSSGNFGDIFIVQYNSSGTVVWAKKAGGSSNDVGSSVATDPSGNIYLTGNFFSTTAVFGTDTLTRSGSFDAFIVKYNSSGNVLWAKNGVGTDWDAGDNVAADAFGNVYLAGGYSASNSTSISFDSDTLPFPAGGNEPSFLFKFDSFGNVLCASSLTSGGIDGGVGYCFVAITGMGDAIVAGSYWTNPFVVGADSLLLTGTRDIFISKYSCTLNSTNELNSEESISLYPNPSNGIFTLNCKIPNGKISVCNLLGEIVFQSNINSPASTIDLSNEPNGIYFIVVEKGEENFTEKIIVSH